MTNLFNLTNSFVFQLILHKSTLLSTDSNDATRITGLSKLSKSDIMSLSKIPHAETFHPIVQDGLVGMTCLKITIHPSKRVINDLSKLKKKKRVLTQK